MHLSSQPAASCSKAGKYSLFIVAPIVCGLFVYDSRFVCNTVGRVFVFGPCLLRSISIIFF